MRFNGKGEQAARREHLADRRCNRHDIAAVNKNVGGQREMVLRASLGGKELHQVGNLETIVKPFGACLLHHAKRNVDAGEPIARGPERRAAEARATAEVEHRAKAQWCALDGSNSLQQQFRPAIIEPLHQRLVEIRRVLVEQAAHIDAGHRGVASPTPSRARCSRAP